MKAWFTFTRWWHMLQKHEFINFASLLHISTPIGECPNFRLPSDISEVTEGRHWFILQMSDIEIISLLTIAV